MTAHPKHITYIPADRISILQERLEKINNRLLAAGVQPVRINVGEPIVGRKEHHGLDDVEAMLCPVEVERNMDGGAGKIRMLGKSNVDPDTGFMTHRSFTNLSDAERDFFDNPTHPTHCDHCGTNRKRTEMFVVETPDSLIRVGSSCLDDFVGVKVNAWTKSFEKVLEHVESLSDIRLEDVNELKLVSVDSFLREACKSIDQLGYYSARDYGPSNTGRLVFDMITGRDPGDAGPAVHNEQYVDQAEQVIQYIANSEFRADDKNTDYFVNLRNLVNFGHLSIRQSSMLASAVRSMQIFNEKEQKRLNSQHIGNHHLHAEGVRTVFKNLTVDAYYHSEGQFGYTTKIHYLDEDNNLMVWKKSGYHEPTIGEVKNLMGTVTDHNTWFSRKYEKDIRETRINRCTELSAEQVEAFEAKEARRLAREAKRAEKNTSLHEPGM